MKPIIRWRSGTAAFLMCSVGLGLGIGAVTTGLTAQAGVTISVFDVHDLVPGDTVTSHLELPSGNQPLTPYLKALNLSDGCVTGKICTPNGPKLSDTLRLVVSDPGGQSWQGTFGDLTTATALPGGQLPANSGSRRYDISLTVPASLTNGSEDRTLALDLEWGGMDAAGQPVTTVEGSTFGRGGGTGSGNSGSGKVGSGAAGHGVSVLGEHVSRSNQPSGLPFTGADVLVELIAAASLIAAGAMLLVAGKRRWRSRNT